ncbi:transposase [Corallococcus macrosporus]|uniref:transposase n=1 Tax=Corallococcus macrosporus TaxID=35 RepID=UPI0023D8E554|nr:transposase [Corallococcus macrosporus]
MRRELVPDALRKRIAPLLLRRRHAPRRGRARCDDRAALRAIRFVLKTGIAWEDLQAEVFGVSGITCWRRLDACRGSSVIQVQHFDREPAGGGERTRPPSPMLLESRLSEMRAVSPRARAG